MKTLPHPSGPRARPRPGGNGPLAASLEILPGGQGGRIDVLIDQKLVFLPPRLAALLKILTADRRPGKESDGLVTWCTLDAVESGLGIEPGLRSSDRIVTNLLCRLRDAIESQAQLPRHFIQRDRLRGIRVALPNRHAPAA